MIIPFIALALMLAFIPVGMRDDIWTIGAASGILAAALMMIAIALPVTSLARLVRLLSPALLAVLAVPALWMLFQVIPMPARSLANPIWGSASAALHQSDGRAITIDIGETMLALARYAAMVAAALVTTAVALDRQRAAHILHILVAVTTLVAARQLVLEAASFDHALVDGSGDGGAQNAVLAIAGILLSCATIIRCIGQLQRVGRPPQSRASVIAILSGAALSLIICTAAILVYGNPTAILAAIAGTATLLAVFAIRRWFLGPWGVAGIAAAAAIGLLLGFAAIPAKKNADLTVAFSAQNQTATERMLSDMTLAGSGAGTFNALLPLYRDIGAVAGKERPTTAAATTIEMGAIFLLGAIVVALLGAWVLFHRSLARGHDYIYSAVGAGALVALPIVAFADGSILNFGASLTIGVLCGLALAQSLSGSTRDVAPLELQEKMDDPPRQGRSASSPAFDRTWPRVALAIFGLVLTEQAAWILSAERYSVEQNVNSIAATRDETRRAAATAVVRGDLWAASGFALAGHPLGDPAVAADRDPEPALDAFTHALRYAPHRSDVWLMLASLASRYKLAGPDVAALLKMSYYTAPNDVALLPLRLQVALSGNGVPADPELRDMIKQDIRLILSRQPALRPALLAAYRSASAGGKVLAENVISEIDPGYLKTMRAP